MKETNKKFEDLDDSYKKLNKTTKFPAKSGYLQAQIKDLHERFNSSHYSDKKAKKMLEELVKEIEGVE